MRSVAVGQYDRGARFVGSGSCLPGSRSGRARGRLRMMTLRCSRGSNKYVAPVSSYKLEARGTACIARARAGRSGDAASATEACATRGAAVGAPAGAARHGTASRGRGCRACNCKCKCKSFHALTGEPGREVSIRDTIGYHTGGLLRPAAAFGSAPIYKRHVAPHDDTSCSSPGCARRSMIFLGMLVHPYVSYVERTTAEQETGD